MKPITREEQYLNKLTGEDQTTPEPVTREEQYLSRLCGADNIIPQKPELRREYFLAALCGEEVETPEPVTRIEQYMNFAAGKSQSKPEKAITREEMYWDKYQGGAVPEEKTVQGDIIHITDATGDNAVALSVALTPTQDGTPWISDTLNTEPYLSRAAQNGNTADETIVGGTVCFNQMIQNGDFAHNSGWSSGLVNLSISDNKAIATRTDTGSAASMSHPNITYINNHKYVVFATVTPSVNTFKTRFRIRDDSDSVSGVYGNYNPLNENTTKTISYIFNPDFSTTNGRVYLYFDINGGNIGDRFVVENFMMSDLTQMFGSTIADYVYSLETATAGAGVAWLRSHGFTDDNYHAYNPGELISAKPTAKVVGDTTYALGGADLRGLFKLDANNNLYCDGDVYTSDGTITRNFEYRAYQSGDESLTDAITDGTNTVVKLTTATTETSTAYTNPQKAGEAEAFVDARTEKVPVGHSTRYSAEYDINGFEGVTVHVSETQTGGTTYPVTFTSQGTVYGGTVDVVSGEMSITYAIEDLGNLSWITVTFTSLGIVFMAYLQADDTGTSYVTAYAKANLPAFSYGEYSLESDNLFIRDPRTTDGNEFKRLVTGQKIVYKLAEPITATIDPTEISLNEGENYVWTEEGTTTLTYMAKAAQRVLAMNRTLQKNLKSIELKKGGDVK